MRFARCTRETMKPRTGKVISIIGAGPAGLHAAGKMVCEGHEVHVYDMLPEPGGLLLFGIPDFRVPKKPIEEGIRQLRDLGVVFHCNVKVGRDIDLEDIISRSDAVLIATGTWKGRKLNIPGSDLDGVYSAFDYMVKLYLHKRGYLQKSQVPSLGKKVIVVGGGETALDTARTAIREGAEEVTIVYRRSIKEMPSKPTEVRIAEKEGVRFRWLTQPIRLIGGPDGRVRAMEAVKMRLGEPDESGRPRPEPVPGSEHLIECDTVFFAIGEVPTPPFEDGKYGIKLTKWGTIWTDEKGRTTRKGVFAAGDVVTGPSLIGNALRTSMKAVQGIMEYLSTGAWDVKDP